MRTASSYTLHDYNRMCTVVLGGTYLLIAALSILLWINFNSGHNAQALSRLFMCGVGFLYVAPALPLLHSRHRSAVAYVLVSFYLFLGTEIVWSSGTGAPLGLLLLALVIVLAGMLLKGRHALVVATIAGSVVVATQLVMAVDRHSPSMSWTGNELGFGDAVVYIIVFCMLAFVLWLYSHEMERSLTQAYQEAEAAVSEQRATSERQAEERTAQLCEVQLEEMQHMYRFAELGQLGVTLLHDLANYLTALTLELEGLKSRRHTQAITRARRITRYLNDIVHTTRERLRGDTRNQTFDIIRKTTEAFAFLHDKAEKANIVIDWQPQGRSWEYTGDPDSLTQVIAILTNNAIEAYESAATKASVGRVAVTMQRDDGHITIKIKDWGKGIPATEREHLFKPSHSAKKSGLGLGLYIAKQTVEVQFLGTLKINPRLDDSTEFIIQLPRPSQGDQPHQT